MEAKSRKKYFNIDENIAANRFMLYWIMLIVIMREK